MPKRIDAAVETEIVRAYCGGESGAAVARRFGVGKTTVYRVLRRQDIKRRPSHARPYRFPPAKEAEIAQRYVDVESSAQVAEEYDCSTVLVRTIARRHGVPVNPRGGQVIEWGDEKRAEIKQQYEDGASQDDIAAARGISQMTVSRILREDGVSCDRKFERHGSWKGGRAKMGDYVSIRVRPDDPYASMRTVQGYVLEHRLVMAQQLGRPLEKHETVHHINGDKRDNRPENLQLRNGRHGKGESLVCADCGSRHIVYEPLAQEN